MVAHLHDAIAMKSILTLLKYFFQTYERIIVLCFFMKTSLYQLPVFKI